MNQPISLVLKTSKKFSPPREKGSYFTLVYISSKLTLKINESVNKTEARDKLLAGDFEWVKSLKMSSISYQMKYQNYNFLKGILTQKTRGKAMVNYSRLPLLSITTPRWHGRQRPDEYGAERRIFICHDSISCHSLPYHLSSYFYHNLTPHLHSSSSL